jgi:hypothetical protein
MAEKTLATMPSIHSVVTRYTSIVTLNLQNDVVIVSAVHSGEQLRLLVTFIVMSVEN